MLTLQSRSVHLRVSFPKVVQLKEMVWNDEEVKRQKAKLPDTLNGMGQVICQPQQKNDKHNLGLEDNITSFQAKIDELKDINNFKQGVAPQFFAVVFLAHTEQRKCTEENKRGSPAMESFF